MGQGILKDLQDPLKIKPQGTQWGRQGYFLGVFFAAVD